MCLSRSLTLPQGTALAVAKGCLELSLFDRLTGGIFAGFTREERRLLRLDASEGFEELNVKAGRVAVHSELMGGPYWFVESGDHVVFMGGTWLYGTNIVSDADFPDPEDGFWSAFDLVRSGRTGIVLEMRRVSDEVLKPVFTLDCPLPYLGESYILPGSLEQLEQTLAGLVEPLRRPEPSPPIAVANRRVREPMLWDD